MSAVVLVGKPWQPDVVQLLPYAHGNISDNTNLKDDIKGINGKRCFPILAVTRSQSGLNSNDSGVSVETYSSLAFSDYKSELSDCAQFSDTSSVVSTIRDTKFRKITRHSSMRERKSEMMVKFAIQDLNEQSGTMTPRRNSVTSIDTGVSMTTISAASGSITSNGLPKPMLSDKKYLYKQNGYKKTLTQTPGELELQKQKDRYIKEQAQKSKMYKLNVNQLPRSNTPITDHDPDKLNMRQVIRFLQKQKPPITPRPSKSEQISPERRSVDNVPKTAPSHMMGDKIRSDLKTSDSMRSRAGEINIASRSKLVSRNSEPSSRSMSQSGRYHVSRKSDDGIVSQSTESFVKSKHDNGDDKCDQKSLEQKKQRDKNKSSRKRAKEFKLHRFLALAPNGEGQNSNPLVISNFAQVRTNNWVSSHDSNDRTRSPARGRVTPNADDRLYIRRVSSEKPTVAHYRALKKENATLKCDRIDDRPNESTHHRSSSEKVKSKSASPSQKMIRFQKVNINDNASTVDSEDGFLSASTSSMIRLPSVHDNVEEEDEDTVMHDSSKSDLERPSPVQILESDIEAKREINVSRSSADTSRCSFYSMPLLSSSISPRRNVKSKQSIHISLPKQESNKEIRISLRQEKDLPASHTYMSDIAPRTSPDIHRPKSKDINDNISNSSGDTLNDKSVVSRISFHTRKAQEVGSCEDTRMSPDSHVTFSSVGAVNNAN